MAKVDLLLVSGLTASDGSIVASGATLKFDSEFIASTTDVRIQPKLYRDRELFESGYTHIWMPESTIPASINLSFTDEEFYGMTPLVLYEKVGIALNGHLGGDFFELIVIDE